MGPSGAGVGDKQEEEVEERICATEACGVKIMMCAKNGIWER